MAGLQFRASRAAEAFQRVPQSRIPFIGINHRGGTRFANQQLFRYTEVCVNFKFIVPRPRKILNAFTAQEMAKITGLSRPMIDYLAREAYLIPTYSEGRIRGRVRYYSYRDLVIARAVQRLRETGVELRRLKDAIQVLKRDPSWGGSGRSKKPIIWMVTDGKSVLLRSEDGFFEELRPGGQRAFAFIVSLDNLKAEVRAAIPKAKNQHFSTENRPLIFAQSRWGRR